MIRQVLCMILLEWGYACQFCQLCFEGECIVCEDGYKLEGAYCFRDVCRNKVNGMCVDCDDGLTLVDGRCLVSKCEIQNTARTCMKCEIGYDNHDGLCKPTNCIEFSKDTLECTLCRTGFTANSADICVADNCASISPTTFSCLSCTQNYTLDDGVCLLQNCALYMTGTYICTQCSPYYILHEEENICVSHLQYCSRTNEISLLCEECEEGYVGVAGVCVRKVNGCTMYGITGCVRCDKGWQPTLEGSCQLKNCVDSVEGQCRQCESGYDVVGTLCMPKNCELFSEEAWTCNLCMGRFTIKHGRCVTKNCVYFSQDGINCFLCEDKYHLHEGQCLLANCLHKKQEACWQCEQGWLLDDNRLCSIKDCLQYKDNNVDCARCHVGKRLHRGICLDNQCLLEEGKVCMECQKGYRLIEPGFCIPLYCNDVDKITGECLSCANKFQFDGRQCADTRCTAHDENGGCKQCISHHTPEQEYCIPPNCRQYDAFTHTCSQCSLGYTINPSYPPSVQTLCHPQNCMRTSVNFTCEECSLGYSFFYGICLVNNCSQFGTYTQCIACVDGFEMLGGICVTQRCLEVGEEGFCVGCENGYELEENYTCVRKHCQVDSYRRCQRCKYGFFIDIQGFCLPYNCEEYREEVCLKCPELFYDYEQFCVPTDCQLYDEHFQCTKCQVGFRLISGMCQQSIQNFCPQGQYFDPDSSLCATNQQQNCQIPYNSSQCSRCLTDYMLSEGKCFSLANCSYYPLGRTCQNCDPGFILEQKVCKSTVPFCSSYKNNGKCQQCQQEYVLTVYGKCERKPFGCSHVHIDGSCVKCEEELTLRRGSCYLLVDACQKYSKLDGQCLECTQGLYYNRLDKKCKFNPENCARAGGVGQCLECMDNYHYIQPGFCVQYVERCLKYTVDGCEECKPGWQIVQSSCAVKNPIQHCISYNDSGECTQCSKDYFLKFSGLCLRKEFILPPSKKE